MGEDYSSVGGQLHKGLDSLVVLGAWTIWNHHNRCVFYGVPPCLARALLLLVSSYSCAVWLGLKVFFTFSPSRLSKVHVFFKVAVVSFSFTGAKVICSFLLGV